jgi:hypothetical protein
MTIMASKKTHYSCAVSTCLNKFVTASGLKPTKHFFAIPNAPLEKRKAWFDAINFNQSAKINDNCIGRKYLCEDHFSDECFSNTNKNRLNKFAIPTIFNNNNNIKIIENIHLSINNTVAAETTINSDISFESKSNEIPKSPCKDVQKRRLSPETPRNDTKRTKRFSILKEINCRTVS